jgi:hypothetical protein
MSLSLYFFKGLKMSGDGRNYSSMDTAITKLGGASGDQVMERVKQIMPGLMGANVSLNASLDHNGPRNQ